MQTRTTLSSPFTPLRSIPRGMTERVAESHDIETAGRQIDHHINADSSFPSLSDRLRSFTQGNSATVSGLNENDYPNAGGDVWSSRYLTNVRKVPLPADLTNHFQHMQCNSMMGLFPSVGRAWLTIDSDIYIWMFRDGSDLAYFDGLQETILSVGLVTPKPGVFKPYISHLLCLTTTTEIVLLGVSFMAPVEDNTEGDASPVMHLLPEPLFSVASDGVYILCVSGTNDGRIFMGGKDGCLYELIYQAEDGWFSRKCRKVNHSKSFLSFLVPSLLSFSDDDPIVQMEMDERRHILYTMSERGSISVYDLESNGRGLSLVTSWTRNNVANVAMQVARTVDSGNFKRLVALCIVSQDESIPIHFIIVTSTGVRLYFTTTNGSSTSHRPTHLTLLHVRLPPGFTVNARTSQPNHVHHALYSHGCGVLCGSENGDKQRIWTTSGDQFPTQLSLAETQSSQLVDGHVWAAADITEPLWCRDILPLSTQGTVPPLLVTQHQQAARQFVLLSATGAHLVTFNRPVDHLRLLLEEGGGSEGPLVKEFFSALSPLEASASALILATDLAAQSAQVSEAATRALFLHGIHPQVQGGVGFSQVMQTPTSFHPMQVSTPLSPQTPYIGVQPEGGFSPLHNALFLYLSRLVRPVWQSSIAKEIMPKDNLNVTCLVKSEEAGFLAEKVRQLSQFVMADQYVAGGVGGSFPLNLSMSRDVNAVNERTSLQSLRTLLSQTLEVLRLLSLLSTHNFPAIFASLPNDMRDLVRSLTCCDLVVQGREVCRALIVALLDRYQGDNASSDAICCQLREVCPTLFRLEDAKLAKANEMISSARITVNCAERQLQLREAVMLCKQIGTHVNVSAVCAQLALSGEYEGLVDVCLSVANQRDPSGLAIHFYRNNEPVDDRQGMMAFATRMECYQVILHNLGHLMDSVAAAPFPPCNPSSPLPSGLSSQSPGGETASAEASHNAEKMIAMVTSGNDETAHVALYQWLIETNRGSHLLAISSPFLESFLTRSVSHLPLLWRYYERNREYYKAAKALVRLADQEGHLPLTERVEYLSRGIMCLNSCDANTSSSYSDFMLHLEEKKDVARVQLNVLEALQSRGVHRDVIGDLNQSLLDLMTLYEKFASPWQLYECQLAIVQTGDVKEPQLIQSLWSKILDSELDLTQGSDVTTRVDSLSSKVKALSRIYANRPAYFPLEHIVNVCERHSLRLNADITWVATTMQNCGTSLLTLIDVYNRLYCVGDAFWEMQGNPFHLLRVLSHLFSVAAQTPAAVAVHERRPLRERCLDLIARYLTQLDSSADPSGVFVAADLRACQASLERLWRV